MIAIMLYINNVILCSLCLLITSNEITVHDIVMLPILRGNQLILIALIFEEFLRGSLWGRRAGV